MFAILYHHAHAFDNPSECCLIGPYSSMDVAKVGLAALVIQIDDEDFKIDPDPDAVDNDGTYAGFYWQTLLDKDRDEDIASEVWAEIIELRPEL